MCILLVFILKSGMILLYKYHALNAIYSGISEKGQRPYAQPLGTFWIVSQSELAEELVLKSVQISYCTFEMKATFHGEEILSKQMLDEARRLYLRRRKSVLTSEIETMQLDLGIKLSKKRNERNCLQQSNILWMHH